MSPAPPNWKLTQVPVTSFDAPDTPALDLLRTWLREHNWAVNAPYMTLLHQPEHEACPLILLAHADAPAHNRDLNPESPSHTPIIIIGGLIAETQLA